MTWETTGTKYESYSTVHWWFGFESARRRRLRWTRGGTNYRFSVQALSRVVVRSDESLVESRGGKEDDIHVDVGVGCCCSRRKKEDKNVNLFFFSQKTWRTSENEEMHLPGLRNDEKWEKIMSAFKRLFATFLNWSSDWRESLLMNLLLAGKIQWEKIF